MMRANRSLAGENLANALRSCKVFHVEQQDELWNSHIICVLSAFHVEHLGSFEIAISLFHVEQVWTVQAGKRKRDFRCASTGSF